MTTGHSCDNCQHTLQADEFHGYGSWSYTCANCGFVYHHGRKTAREQVAEFTGEDEEEFEDDEE